MARQIIRVGHSPDPDDAFMFHALANGKIDTSPYHFQHELVDIETLNRRAFSADLELTAVSLHGYAYVTDSMQATIWRIAPGGGFDPTSVRREFLVPDFFSNQNPEATDAALAFIPVQWISLFDQTGFNPSVPGVVGKRNPVTLKMEWRRDEGVRIPAGFHGNWMAEADLRA